MNFGFESSRRKVSLGGRSKAAESREEVLRRTHAERERRARERLEYKSAVCIQSSWRRAAAVQRHRDETRQAWNVAFGSRLEERVREKDLRFLSAALRHLNHFTRPDVISDVVRLADVGHLVFGSAGVPDIIQAAAQAEHSEGQILCLQLAQLATLSIRSLKSHREHLASDEKLLPALVLIPYQEAYIALGLEEFERLFALGGRAHVSHDQDLNKAGKELLLVVLKCTANRLGADLQLWQRAGNGGPAALSRLCWILGNRGGFRDLAVVLRAVSEASETAVGRQGDAESSARGGIASTSAAQPKQKVPLVEYGAPNAAIAACIKNVAETLREGQRLGPDNQIFTPFLCVPYLWTRCKALKPDAALFWELTLRELRSSSDAYQMNIAKLVTGRPGAATALLCNLSQAAHLISLEDLTRIPKRLHKLSAAAICFCNLGTELLQHVPLGALFPKAVTEEDDNPEDIEMLDAAQGSKFAAQWVGMEPDRLAGQLKLLVVPTTVRMLVNLLLPEATLQLEDLSGRECSNALCCLLGTLLRSQALQTETQLALAVNPALVPRLWHAHLKAGFQGGRWIASDDESSSSSYMLPLLLLSHCFGMFLATSSEASFYEQQRPLAFSELWKPNEAGLLGLLKYALWQILWVDQGRARPGRPTAVQNLRAAVGSAVGRVLSQLYDRNCRRQFTAPEAFFAPQLSEGLFEAEVQSLLGKGGFLEAEHSRVWLILKHAPFLVPFRLRAIVFQQVVGAEKEDRQVERRHFDFSAPLAIRREHLFWDSFEHLNSLGPGLKDRLPIVFVDKYGMQEAGIGPGLFKDLMENLVKEGYDPQLGLFLGTSDNRLYPNPNASLAMESAIPAFEFLGRILGKAMYEGIIVELPLAAFFLKQLLRKGVDVNDLSTLDAELYRNLMFLRNYEGDVEDLSLSFTITKDIYGDIQERELVPVGRNIIVTQANRAEYILRTANFRLNVETRPYTDAFRRGLYEVIEPVWVSMFNEEELQMLIRGGGSSGIDVDDLRQNISYAGGYDDGHPTIKAFWEALAGFTSQQQAAWLKFVTACSRAPLLGFKHLSPQLCIAKAGQDSDPESQERLPTSATCMNLLKLPPMRTPQQISAKLLYAIENVSGFDLS